MKILKDDRENSGWITAISCDRWIQAKVYDLPSVYGINNGRVSKLVIGKTDTRNPYRDFFDQMDYNYDRGLDFDELPEGVLEDVVDELENLPLIFDYEE